MSESPILFWIGLIFINSFYKYHKIPWVFLCITQNITFSRKTLVRSIDKRKIIV